MYDVIAQLGGCSKSIMKIKYNPVAEGRVHSSSLTPGNTYRVIELVIDMARVMNDVGEPGLFYLDQFIIVDEKWPEDWIVSFGEDGERYAGPACLSAPGFFEDYFDGKKEAIKTLRQRLLKWQLGED